ncbi:zinc finger BED domain-containing protein RICESLEEPER 2-like [Rhizophagus irregularis DAOM 181602=DAOM 197198]|nr:zinc finger BED domain-containing protein RICESLEEPER 2-like [Rhizophagus irregularis DAOM 181602=DAOM 197198]
MADSSLIEIIDESENEAFSDIFIEDEFIFNPEDDESIDEAEETITDIKVASPIISPIWKFFTRKEKIEKNQEGDEQLIKYIHCNIGECFLSANNSTTTLERHLKAKHNNVYVNLHNFADVALEPWSAEEQKEKHAFLINWVIIDQQPFTLVENLSFQKFMLAVQPRYKLPSRHTLKEMIISKFKKSREEVSNNLQLLTSKVSLTMDMWTSINALDAVLEITNEFQVTNQLIGITSDNEAKMIAATRQIKETLELSTFQHYRCAAHILNLVVSAALEIHIIPQSVKKLRNFISTVRNSPKQMDKLKEYFRVEDIDFKTPLPDIVTRWNYTYYMIERALEIKPLLAHLVSNLQTLTNNWPTEEKWEILADLLELLAPFALITKVISASSYPTIGEVKWLFFGIKNHLEKSRNDDYKLQAQINEMKRVFNNYFGQFNKSLHIPAFFDPRYKKSSYGNMSREEVFQPIQELMANYQELTTPVSQTTTVRRRLASLSLLETRSYFQDLFMPNQTQQLVSNELDIYFDSHPPGNEVMPLDWWKIHATEFPVLAKMARDYLTIMSTSVPCEQFFSVAGKQITQTRNRLHPETARACLCLKSWLEQGKVE